MIKQHDKVCVCVCVKCVCVQDPPPDLVIGDDDIFWMSKLHAGLEEKGFHPGDFDMENWVYGAFGRF